MNNKVFNKPLMLLCIAVFAASLIISLLGNLIHPFWVTGESMYPTFNDGDIVSTKRFSSIDELSIGDVIIINVENSYLIKRIEGLPGQTLSISHGKVIRDGAIVEEPYENIWKKGILSCTYTVPSNSVFVLGDNRNNSKDSRVFGAVSEENIISIVKRPLKLFK